MINREAGEESGGMAESSINAPEKFWNRIKAIEEISIQAGLGRIAGGDASAADGSHWEQYKTSLRLMIREIDKCGINLNDFLTAGDMHGFSIEAHSMKSSLANIGAMELSALARGLETAADKGDAGYCSANLPAFLEALRGMRSSLAEAFAEEALHQGPAAIPPELPPILEKLAAAFTATDFLAIDQGIESLDALNPDRALKSIIEQIKDAALVMDYDGAMEVIQKLINPVSE